MSFYRCLFCGGKFEEYGDDDLFKEATEKDVKDSEWDIEGSDYEWVVCKVCNRERGKRGRYFAKKRDKKMMLKDIMLLATKYDISTNDWKLK